MVLMRLQSQFPALVGFDVPSVLCEWPVGRHMTQTGPIRIVYLRFFRLKAKRVPCTLNYGDVRVELPEKYPQRKPFVIG